MGKEKKMQHLSLNKMTISDLTVNELRGVYGGIYTETCQCSTETTKEITQIPGVTDSCWTDCC